MSRIPVNFQRTGEGAIPTYSNINFLLRKGNIVFYGGRTENGYALDVAPFYSSQGKEKTIIAANTAGDIDIDFVGDIEYPLTIEGNVIVVVPLLHHLSSGTAAVTTTLTAYLRTWDGTTETTLGSANAAVASPSAASNYVYGSTWSLNFDIARTKLIRGQTIRLTITTSAAGANTQIAICHDPIDRNAEDDGMTSPGGTLTQPDSTALILSIPARLDL